MNSETFAKVFSRTVKGLGLVELFDLKAKYCFEGVTTPFVSLALSLSVFFSAP